MGNRVNYGFKGLQANDDPTAPVLYLYLHWGPHGNEIPQRLATALDETRRRWNDPAYGSRWVICKLLDGIGLEETGSGFTINCQSDNENVIYVTDYSNCTVNNGEQTWTFDEFIREFNDDAK